MTRHRHRAVQKRIDRLFIAGLDSAARSAVFEAIEGCAPCAEHYRRHQQLESMLTGSVALATTPFARERVLQAVLASANVANETSARAWNLRRTAAVLGAIGVAAVLALMVLLPKNTPNPHRLTIPDEAAFPPAPVIAAKGHPMRDVANIGIRVFQVSRLGEQVTETKALSADDVLAFTYTFAEERPGYLALFGIQEGGEVLWYYPEYGQPRSIPIKGGVVDEPLQEGIDLAVNHRPGWLRITALFSDEPIEVDAVEEAVETLRRRGDELNPSNPFPEAEYATLKGQYSVKVKIKGKR